MRRYTALRDIDSDKDHLVAPPAVQLPATVDVSQWMPPHTDQGQEGSCTAQTGVALLSWLYNRFHGLQLDFSAQFLYRAERLTEGDPASDGGAQSRTMMSVLRDVGVCLEKSDPYTDTGWLNKTTDAQLAEAEMYKIGAYHRVVDLSTLKSVLASGYPAALAIDVYGSFESAATTRTGVVQLPGQGEQSIGGHEVTVVGYSDATSALLVRNSWGSGWGDKGNFHLPYAYWPWVMDCWTCHLGQSWK